MLCLRINLMLMLMSLVSTKLFAWFPSLGYVCYVFDTKPLPTWQTITNYQSEFTLHDRLQKSERFAWYPNNVNYFLESFTDATQKPNG